MKSCRSTAFLQNQIASWPLSQGAKATLTYSEVFFVGPLPRAEMLPL